MLFKYLECPSCSLRVHLSPRAWVPDDCPRCAVPLRNPALRSTPTLRAEREPIAGRLREDPPPA